MLKFWFVAILLPIPVLSQAKPSPPSASGMHAESIIVEGKAYFPLLKAQLKSTIVGHQIGASYQSSPHVVAMMFGKDGTYEKYVGADLTDRGTYVVSRDSVWVRGSHEEPVQRRFIQAADGELMMATIRRGEPKWIKVDVQPL